LRCRDRIVLAIVRGGSVWKVAATLAIRRIPASTLFS
jgi:hypothetical protein